MKEETFEEILRCIHLPLGELLGDNTTYRVTHKDFKKIKTQHSKELDSFEKFLVLTSDGNTIVGGIMFYGYTDIHAITFQEYRDRHYMSEVFKNGILESECYDEQEVSLSTDAINNYDDFLKKHYLVSCVKLKIKNLPEIHEHFNIFAPCDEYKGFQEISLDEFIKQFS
jgi:hypothetical protein